VGLGVDNMYELDTSVFGEFGVESKYLDGECHFVSDALAVRLVPTPKLQVFRSVVESVAIFMMHRFVFVKGPTKHLHHRESVSKFFFAAAQVYALVARRMHVAFFGNGSPFTTFVSTIFGAKALSFIITGVFAVFSSAKATFFGFTAKLALKSRCGAFLHEEWFSTRFDFVKLGVNCFSFGQRRLVTC